MKLKNMNIQTQIEDNLKKIFNKHHTTIQTRHFKGHHEKEKETISWEGKLNIQACALAKEASRFNKPKETHLPEKIVSIWEAYDMVMTKI